MADARRQRRTFVLLWLGGLIAVAVNVVDIVSEGVDASDALDLAVIGFWVVVAAGMVPPFIRATRTVRADPPEESC